MKKSKENLHPVIAVLLVLTVMLAFQACSKNIIVDWRKLDTLTKRYHFAQLSFEDMQKDYIAMFPKQPEETQTYLQKNVAPVLHDAKLALGAWSEVIMQGAINLGQESQFTKLFDDVILLLKPYLIKKEEKK